MKFIHTADWHLGNTMHDIDRTEEARKFLEWLKGQVVAQGAQALVVAGDIFDVVNPTNCAKTLYYRFLASLIGTGCTNVIVVGGNHDSGALLDAPAELLAALNVTVVGTVNGRSVDDLVFELRDASGNAIGICCAVPFMRDLELAEFYRGKLDAGETDQGTAGLSAEQAPNLLKKLYGDVYAKAVELRGDRRIPIVATGHLYAADLPGRDAEGAYTKVDDGVRDVVGNLGNVASDVFPAGLDYVALGHIHYYCKVAKNPKICYSGSPFVMGFDESGYDRHILAVDVGEELKVEKIAVPKTIRFEQIKGSLESIRKSLRALDGELAQNPMETYVDVVLTEGSVVNLNDELAGEEMTKRFTVKRHRISGDLLKLTGAAYSECVESTQQYKKEEYFKMLIASKMQKDLKSSEVGDAYDEFLDLFNEAVEDAHKSMAGDENK